MYNAYRENTTMDKFNIVLRQLCCHPKIVADIKNAISGCNTLQDIEIAMISKYKSDVFVALKKTKFIELYIKRLYRKLEIAEWKQYARGLRKMEYRIKFDLH